MSNKKRGNHHTENAYRYFIVSYLSVIFLFRTSANTVCPRSSDPFYIVIYYTKWVTTSWTHSIASVKSDDDVLSI